MKQLALLSAILFALPAVAAAQSRPHGRKVERKPYQTEPGRGLAPSEIEAVLAEAILDIYSDTPSAATSRVVLLLENGEYCTDPDVPPADLDAAAHKRAHPRAWGRWRRKRGGYELIGDRAMKAPGDIQKVLAPARPGQTLNETFRHVGGGSSGGTTIATARRITFLPDGTFQLERSATVTTGAAGAGSSGESRGTYRVEAGTIELRFEDGAVSRRALYWLDGRKRDAAYIGGDLFVAGRR